MSASLRTNGEPARLELTAATYRQLMKMAHRHARHPLEPEDLLHETLIVALVANNRPDVNCQAWLHGVMRNVAATKRRSAFRRLNRESAVPIVETGNEKGDESPKAFLASLPKAQRIVALLALGGHTRSEIRHLLRISDASLRQRIAELRKRWQKTCPDDARLETRLSGTLSFGAIRRALLPLTGHEPVFLASHDPDGHLFAMNFSFAKAHKTATGGNKKAGPTH